MINRGEGHGRWEEKDTQGGRRNIHRVGGEGHGRWDKNDLKGKEQGGMRRTQRVGGEAFEGQRGQEERTERVGVQRTGGEDKGEQGKIILFCKAQIFLLQGT